MHYVAHVRQTKYCTTQCGVKGLKISTQIRKIILKKFKISKAVKSVNVMFKCKIDFVQNEHHQLLTKNNNQKAEKNGLTAVLY